jgi:hypothetical protein
VCLFKEGEERKLGLRRVALLFKWEIVTMEGQLH